MRLYFLRHGEADWPDWKGPDNERPLTKPGRKEMHRVGEFFAERKLKIDCILTSPLPRAEQTADIMAEHLKIVCHQERLLTPGFRAEDLARVLRKHPGGAAIMLVGHEPDFSTVIKSLTGGEVKLSKAGLALVEYSGKKGRLLWLMPPKLSAT